MLSCREASRLISAAQEGPLDARARLALRMHLLMCHGCRNLQQQLAWLRQFSRHYRDHPGAPADTASPDSPDRPV